MTCRAATTAPPVAGDAGSAMSAGIHSRRNKSRVVEIQNQAELAYAAGYKNQRGAKRTWEDHITCSNP